MTRVALILLLLGWAVTAPLTDLAADTDSLNAKLEAMIERLGEQREHLDRLEGELSSEREPLDARLLTFDREMIDLQHELRQGGGGDLVPGWMTRDLRFDAKVRLRYAYFGFDDRTYLAINNRPQHIIALDREPRHTLRGSVWMGFEKDWGDDFTSGFRITSTQGGATSTDFLVDNYFQEQPVGIDRAFIDWHPRWAVDNPFIKDFRIVAGKFANPLTSTGMLWDSDVQPEGIYEKIAFQHEDWGGFEPYATFAQLIASEIAFSDDVTCQAWQLGFDWRFDKDVTWEFAATYYDWDGFEDAINRDFDFGGNFLDAPFGLNAANLAGNVFPRGARATTLFGNTISVNPRDGQVYYDVGDFDLINIYNSVTFNVQWGEKRIPVKPFFDIVWNEAEANEVFAGAARLGRRNYNDGHTVGVVVGSLKKKGDWQALYKYGHVEANAVVGRFGEGFFHYANYRAHLLGGGYKLHDKISLLGGMYWVEPIFDPDHTKTLTPIVRLDLVYQF